MAIVSDRKIQYQKDIGLFESRRDMAAQRVSWYGVFTADWS